MIEWEYKYSETFKPGFWAETMNGANAVIWWHLSAIDVQNKRNGTVFRQQGPVMERYSPQLLKELFDTGALESIHRGQAPGNESRARRSGRRPGTSLLRRRRLVRDAGESFMAAEL